LADLPAKKKFKNYPIGFFHIDIAEVQTAEGGSVINSVYLAWPMRVSDTVTH